MNPILEILKKAQAEKEALIAVEYKKAEARRIGISDSFKENVVDPILTTAGLSTDLKVEVQNSYIKFEVPSGFYSNGVSVRYRDFTLYRRESWQAGVPPTFEFSYSSSTIALGEAREICYTAIVGEIASNFVVGSLFMLGVHKAFELQNDESAFATGMALIKEKNEIERVVNERIQEEKNAARAELLKVGNKLEFSENTCLYYNHKYNHYVSAVVLKSVTKSGKTWEVEFLPTNPGGFIYTETVKAEYVIEMISTLLTQKAEAEAKKELEVA